MASKAEWREQRKESGKWNMEEKCTQSEQRQKMERKVLNSASRSYGTITKDLTFISVEPQKERGKWAGLKNSKKILAENLPLLQLLCGSNRSSQIGHWELFLLLPGLL